MRLAFLRKKSRRQKALLKPSASRRLLFEPLEDRRVMAADIWIERESDAVEGGSVGRFVIHGENFDYDPMFGYASVMPSVSFGEDPIGFNANDPHLARYVGNSPTNLVDPNGLQQTAVVPIDPAQPTHIATFTRTGKPKVTANGLTFKVTFYHNDKALENYVFYQEVSTTHKFFSDEARRTQIASVKQDVRDVIQDRSGAADIHEGPLAEYIKSVERKTGKKVCAAEETSTRQWKFVKSVTYKHGNRNKTWDPTHGDGMVYSHLVYTIGSTVVQDSLEGQLKDATDFKPVGAKIEGTIKVTAVYNLVKRKAGYDIVPTMTTGDFDVSRLKASARDVSF